MRLIFENSTVCLIVDELVCFALGRFVSMFGLFFGNDSGDCVRFVVVGIGFFYGEFDPGSGRTLAACLTHASRAVRLLWGYTSGERVSNT